jgi:hypothetical protein
MVQQKRGKTTPQIIMLSSSGLIEREKLELIGNVKLLRSSFQHHNLLQLLLQTQIRKIIERPVPLKQGKPTKPTSNNIPEKDTKWCNKSSKIKKLLVRA